MVTNAAQARLELLRAGFGVVVEEADRSHELPEDDPDRDAQWWASLTSRETGDVVHRHHGGGGTPDAAVARAWERYQHES